MDSAERHASADRAEVLDQAVALKPVPKLLTKIDLSGTAGEVESFYLYIHPGGTVLTTRVSGSIMKA